MSSTTSTRQPLWLRCETKEFERRAALTPTTAKKLIGAGFDLTVERDPQRIFDDQEYHDAGCTLVDSNTWPRAPPDVPIIGLKELPVSTDPLVHTHIMFAHCYKDQAGWAEILTRFARGGGTLYDLEFLKDENGRRVAAFGFHAGFAGAGAAALALADRKTSSTSGPLTGLKLEPYDNEHDMVAGVKEKISKVKNADGSLFKPKALVIGALGRCGRGAVDLFRKIGLEENDILKWDLDETAKGGPFEEILGVDMFINCIYLSSSIPPFITLDTIRAAGPNRRLSVIADVSCDTTNPFNPIPVYNVMTTFDAPTVEVEVGEGNPPLSVIAIDHLPTLLPREASEQFSSDLLPSLYQLPERKVEAEEQSTQLPERKTPRVRVEAEEQFSSDPPPSLDQLQERKTPRVWGEAEGLFKKKLADAVAYEARN